MREAMNGDAIFSPCGAHRYLLTRVWGSGPTCTFVMLNPSTAGAAEDDATIRRCIGFARREACGRLQVVNLYSLISTDPDALLSHPAPNGERAKLHVLNALRSAAGPVICGWGSHRAAKPAVAAMLGTIAEAGRMALCLGATRDGSPKHPLYLRADAPLGVLADLMEPAHG